MDSAQGENPVSLAVGEVERLVSEALIACRVSCDNAASTAAALVAAERDGQAAHGLSRVRSYAEQALSGKVDGFAIPRLERATDALVRIDAACGFAYPAIDVAIEALTEITPGTGTAAAAIFNSYHFGQAGRHVERLADHGLVAMAFSNTPKAIAIHGGARPLLGTNPLAFAAPVAGRAPIVIDLALSVAARGKIVQASKRGEKIPIGWAIDDEGRPTEDPASALSGSLLPIGGPKGVALAIVIEILCAVLAGGGFSSEASSLFIAEGKPPRLGHVILSFAPAAFSATDFYDRMRQLINEIGRDGHVPGDRRLTQRAHADAEGLQLSREWLVDISRLVAEQAARTEPSEQDNCR